MTSKRLGIFIALSILLHFILLITFQGLTQLLPTPSPRTSNKPVKVTLLPPPPPVPPPLQPSQPVPREKTFVDTTNLPKAEEADPNTPLESENTTQATSKLPGQGSEFLPNQKGVDVPGLDLRNSMASVDTKGQPPAPAPKPEEQEPKEEPQKKPDPKEKPDPKDPVPPKEQKPSQQVKPTEPLPLRPGSDIQLTKAQPEDAPPPAPPPLPKSSQPTENTNPRSPPPTQFSAFKQQNTITGGAKPGEDSSVTSRETDLGRYKAKLFRGIGSRWYLYVQQDTGLLGVGKVKIKFYVRSDGVITNLEILEGKQNAQLAAISRRSIMEISGQLEPFSDSLKLQLGEGYTEEVTFSIY